MFGAALAAGALGSVVGGYLQYKSTKKQIAAQEAQNQANIDLQRQFAQQGVQWRVADAQKAGISPLAALGAQTHSFQPSFVGGAGAGSKESILGDTINSMGQNIGRALMSTATNEERKRQILQTENLRLRNQKIKNDIVMDQQRNSNARVNTPSNPPINSVEVVPSRQSATEKGKQNIQAGTISDVGFVHSGTGLAPVPSVDVKERIEDQLIPETIWALRNYAGPIFSDKGKPSKKQITDAFPGATDAFWNGYEWRPRYKGKTPAYDKAIYNMY